MESGGQGRGGPEADQESLEGITECVGKTVPHGAPSAARWCGSGPLQGNGKLNGTDYPKQHELAAMFTEMVCKDGCCHPLSVL